MDDSRSDLNVEPLISCGSCDKHACIHPRVPQICDGLLPRRFAHTPDQQSAGIPKRSLEDFTSLEALSEEQEPIIWITLEKSVEPS